MASFFIDDGATAARSIRLSGFIAEGAAGTIHHVIGEPGIVVKLYKERKDLPEYEEKIAAMLAAPPYLPAFSYNGRSYVQIAWPTARVVDGQGFRGFVMPEVDFRASTELENILQRSARQRKQLPEFYGARVLLAANLAALMANLHALGHYMVDMKPMNMRFYPHAWYMAILDTDGFSINGTRRLPARQFSDEYIAPDARGKKPEQLGLEQDQFSLAVIIFRLLNNGIHPYQGIDLGNQPTTLQERIFAGLYAYSFNGHRNVGPAPSSIHEYLEDDTRALFDRAFQPTASRPTAAEWRDHLNRLITNKVLVKCPTDSKNHAHFSNGCGLCALEHRMAGARAAAARTSARRQPIQSSGGVLNTLSTGTIGSGSTRSSQTAHGAIQPIVLQQHPFFISLWIGLATIMAVALGLYVSSFQKQAAALPLVAGDPPDARYVLRALEETFPLSKFCRTPAEGRAQPMKVVKFGNDAWAQVTFFAGDECAGLSGGIGYNSGGIGHTAVLRRDQNDSWVIKCNWQHGDVLRYDEYFKGCGGMPREAYRGFYGRWGIE